MPLPGMARDPSVKPEWGAEIDRSHPLTTGLTVSLPMLEGSGEPANDIDGSVYANSAPSVWAPGRDGVGRYATGGTSAVEIPASALSSFMGAPGGNVNPFTMRIVFRPRTWPGGFTTLFDSSDRDPSLFFDTSGNISFNGSSSTSLALTAGAWWDLVFSRPTAASSNGTAGSVYVNGLSRGTFAFSAYGTPSNPLCFGRNPSGGSAGDTDYALIQIWAGRALTAGEVADAYADPWAIYQAPSMLRFFTPSGGGGGGPAFIASRPLVFGQAVKRASYF